VAVGAGVAPPDLEIRMPRGAVITGAIRSSRGTPVVGADVMLLRRPADGSLPSNANSAVRVRAYDQGVYRAYGLMPGTYVVAAAMHGHSELVGIEVPATASVDRLLQELERQGVTASASDRLGAPTFALAPVFYPGTTMPSDAQSVVVAAGEERSGIDIALERVPSLSVEGTIRNSGGPMPPVALQLVAMEASPLSIGARPTLSAAPGPDGHFKYTGVTPGRYELTARSATPRPADAPGRTPAMGSYGSGEPLPPGLDPDVVTWASAEIDVSGNDVSGIELALQPAFHVAGRILLDGTTTVSPDLTKVNITMPYVDGGGGYSFQSNGQLRGRIGVIAPAVAADGTFRVSPVLPGSYRMTATIPDKTWWLRSVLVNGRDVLDVPLDLAGSIDNAVVTFTDRHTSLSGMLQTPAGAPATDYVVLVFPTDRALWRPKARRLVLMRPATDGRFTTPDLPPGEYYIAALTDVDPNDWQHAAFLDTVVGASLKLTIDEGGQKTLDLRIDQ
jgi:hypothetical protein